MFVKQLSTLLLLESIQITSYKGRNQTSYCLFTQDSAHCLTITDTRTFELMTGWVD